MNDSQKDDKMVYCACSLSCGLLGSRYSTSNMGLVIETPCGSLGKHFQKFTTRNDVKTQLNSSLKTRDIGIRSTRNNHDTGSADLHFLGLICFIQSVMITQLKNWIYWMREITTAFGQHFWTTVPWREFNAFQDVHMCRGQQIDLVYGCLCFIRPNNGNPNIMGL